jgi:hypothetical protein|eukprot:COSAG02_NODE_69_length_42323_cov_23.507850_3_plen_234_part_00
MQLRIRRRNLQSWGKRQCWQLVVEMTNISRILVSVARGFKTRTPSINSTSSATVQQWVHAVGVAVPSVRLELRTQPAVPTLERIRLPSRSEILKQLVGSSDLALPNQTMLTNRQPQLHYQEPMSSRLADWSRNGNRSQSWSWIPSRCLNRCYNQSRSRQMRVSVRHCTGGLTPASSKCDTARSLAMWVTCTTSLPRLFFSSRSAAVSHYCQSATVLRPKPLCRMRQLPVWKYS